MSFTGFLDAPVQAQSNNAAVDEIQLLKQTTPAACTSAIAVQNASEPSTTEDCNRQGEINAAIQPFLKVSRLRPQIRMRLGQAGWEDTGVRWLMACVDIVYDTSYR
ncbi:hypothetical protein JG688_00009553 [Phytophthora aleatoria]|uniref:Uncharacterized protein n=1 Tax=Phytophthora aleatoria TaxID=2496075 RepID=A0A8J5IG28_9STRA|nr:hypothetical protein JG688_00009553 [Phytophthora aleatoria]